MKDGVTAEAAQSAERLPYAHMNGMTSVPVAVCKQMLDDAESEALRPAGKKP